MRIDKSAENEPCLHEYVFTDQSLAGTGVKTLDLAKRLLDFGFDVRSRDRVMLSAALFHLLLALAPALASSATDVPPRPSPGCSRAEITRGERLERTVHVEGAERAYVLDAPERLEPGRPVPLLLDFHGLGHSGAGVWRVSGFRELARREPFLTAYPEGLPVRLETPKRVFEGAGWEIRRATGNREVAFVTRLLDTLEGEYCVDRARVYATGFSNGAYLSQLLACTMADRFAAIAQVSGGLLPVPCTPSRPVPVLLYHGRADELIDVEQARLARDAWVRIDGCGGGASTASDREAMSATDPEASAANDRGASADPGARAAADPAAIACRKYGGCRGGAVVEYCEGEFAHRWPVSATERIWSFFLAHPLS